MEVPSMLQGESLKRLLQGIAIGVALTVIVCFNWFSYGFGWTLGGTADTTLDSDLTKCTGPVTANTAHDNIDLGIEAVPGVVDGGGNSASCNGNPLQCTNVFCE